MFALFLLRMCDGGPVWVYLTDTKASTYSDRQVAASTVSKKI